MQKMSILTYITIKKVKDNEILKHTKQLFIEVLYPF